MQIVLGDQEKNILMKLARMNIEYGRNQVLPKATVAEYFDDPEVPDCSIDRPLRLSIDKGTIIVGKMESGFCHTGDQCIIMPSRRRVEIVNFYFNNNETSSVNCGENVQLKLKNVKFDVVIQENPRFTKQDQVAIARLEVLQAGQLICIEPFKCYPQLG
ncbi:unnamed protein product [Rotaria sp. Silwood1]|nr:unnamed protein product [Rotaria sp. Silwood1]CAF4986049.1 unnamed protein product [Rotaria sp. Silwood1]